MTRTVDGRYELLAQLGSGGLATVYHARDRRTETARAIKVLHQQHASDAAVRGRFHREAGVLRQLDHEPIVRLFDAGAEQDGGAVYLVMELVQGETLRQRLDREQALEWDEARRIAAALAQALAHAHETGVVHRDVKPQNVLLGSDGSVKLADFGSARVQSLASLSGSSLVWGSPEYMAPEVFARGRVDPRSDLYSLGVVLHEMVTGQLPWQDDNPLGRLVDASADALPLPLDRGQAVDALISSLLAPVPSGRPASAAVVDEVLSGERLFVASPPSVLCQGCGDPRPEDIPRCVTCGHEELRVRHAPDGTHQLVLLKAPDEAGYMERLHDLLTTLTGQPDLRLKFLTGDRRLYSKREQKEAIPLPAVLFGDLTEADARRLNELFLARQITTEVRIQEPVFSMGKSDRYAIGVSSGVGITGLVAGGTSAVIGLTAAATLLAGAGVLGLMAAGSFYGLAKWRVSRKPPPMRFRLREHGAVLPRSERLLEAASRSFASLRAPEVRELFREVAEEIYRLTHRAEEVGPEQAELTERLMQAAPALQARLLEAAQQLDRLDAALDTRSEAAAIQSLSRLERRLAAASGTNRPPLRAAYEEALAGLERRQATEQERARLAAGLVRTLSDVRDLYRRASRIATLDERELAGVQAASEELERLLAAPDAAAE